ncbi:MAG: prolyl oligopeptidase family serine peptidase [Bacteroidales bacterium]|nr:prolyl oligopeptidase family serine peptidase [Bacteroidales bacterium]
MIKKAFLSLLALQLLGTTQIMGQTKELTLEDLMPGGSTYRYVDNLYNLQWWGDFCIKPAIDKLTEINPKNGKETILTTVDKINSVLESQKLGKLTSMYFVKLPWKNRTEIVFALHNKQIVFDFKKNKVISTTDFNKDRNNEDINYNSNNIAYTIGNNLYVNNDAVTNEPEGIVCGQSVHRNEFGISKGTFWSPSGKLLAFYRMDETMVGQYPLVDTEAREGKVQMIRYPMAGMTSHKVTIGIYNPDTKQTIYLKAGDPTDRYFTNISWAPDEKSIYFIELNRDQNHSKLCRYNAQTGELEKVLIEETNPKYVEPLYPIAFLPWDSNKFIYQSQRSGFNHLYLYNTDGKLLGQLTKGEWLVQSLLGFNNKTKSVIIEGGVALNKNLYSVNIPSMKCSKALGKTTDGVHNGLLSESGQYIVDRYSSPKIPLKIDILDATTSKSTQIFKAEDPYQEYKMPDISVGTIKAADGVTDLYYRIVKPKDMQPGKKYPAIVYVYGGPHAQMINNSWQNDTRGWDIYMANKGYIVFTLDNRGSENRGFDFESVTFRHLGIEECKDQVKGVEFLKSLPYIDGNRIGVHGWSFGGHMTIGLMLRYPDLFKVGVAGGPVIDWKYYEIMYGERYMDTPQTNPEGYKECNLKNYAGNLKGHLLIIHDDHDDTCVPQHSITFLKACINAGTYPDFFTYPGHKHNVIGKDRVHLYEKITRYFVDYL